MTTIGVPVAAFWTLTCPAPGADGVTVVASALDRVAAQVLQLVLEGETRAEIAEHLGISTRTVSRKLAVIRDELRRVACHA